MLPKLHLDEDYPCSLVGNWNTWYGEQDQAGEVPLSPVPLLPPSPGLQQLSYLSFSFSALCLGYGELCFFHTSSPYSNTCWLFSVLRWPERPERPSLPGPQPYFATFFAHCGVLRMTPQFPSQNCST